MLLIPFCLATPAEEATKIVFVRDLQRSQHCCDNRGGPRRSEAYGRHHEDRRGRGHYLHAPPGIQTLEPPAPQELASASISLEQAHYVHVSNDSTHIPATPPSSPGSCDPRPKRMIGFSHVGNVNSLIAVGQRRCVSMIIGRGLRPVFTVMT